MKKLKEMIPMIMNALIGAVCGIMMMQSLENTLEGQKSVPLIISVILLDIVLMYAAYMLQVIIHEGGHYLFGKLSGYRFSSFRILNLMWKKEDGRIVLKKFSLAGTGGQCLMEPPGNGDEPFPFILYNMGGVIVNIVSAVVAVALASVFQAIEPLRMFFNMTAVIGFFTGMLNGIPFSGTVNNDGSNTLELIRNPKTRKAFWLQMKTNALTAQGKRMREMPEEWFETGNEAPDSLSASAVLLKADYLADCGRYDEAEEVRKYLYESDAPLPGVHKAYNAGERICYELMHENRSEVLTSLRTKETDQILKALKSQPAVMRIEYAWALLRDHNKENAEKILADFEKTAKLYPYPGEIEAEREKLAEIRSKAAL